MFFWNSLAFSTIQTNVSNLISSSSAFSKLSLYIWKFLVHVPLKPSLKAFEHKLTNTWNDHTCTVVWTFFGTALFWDWHENWPCPVLWPLLFSKFVDILSAAFSQHHLLRFEIASYLALSLLIIMIFLCFYRGKNINMRSTLLTKF